MIAAFDTDFVPIGKVAKTVGYKGAVLIETYDEYEKTWASLTKCLIKVQDIWAPFFIKSISAHAGLLEVLFEDLADDKAARVIIHQEIFVALDTISLDEDDPSIIDSEWVGFTISDSELGVLGMIVQVKELPGQDLALVEYNGKMVSIPLAEELMLHIDLDKKEVVLNLPLGLLDL